MSSSLSLTKLGDVDTVEGGGSSSSSCSVPPSSIVVARERGQSYVETDESEEMFWTEVAKQEEENETKKPVVLVIETSESSRIQISTEDEEGGNDEDENPQLRASFYIRKELRSYPSDIRTLVVGGDGDLFEREDEVQAVNEQPEKEGDRHPSLSTTEMSPTISPRRRASLEERSASLFQSAKEAATSGEARKNALEAKEKKKKGRGDENDDDKEEEEEEGETDHAGPVCGEEGEEQKRGGVRQASDTASAEEEAADYVVGSRPGVIERPPGLPPHLGTSVEVEEDPFVEARLFREEMAKSERDLAEKLRDNAAVARKCLAGEEKGGTVKVAGTAEKMAGATEMGGRKAEKEGAESRAEKIAKRALRFARDTLDGDESVRSDERGDDDTLDSFRSSTAQSIARRALSRIRSRDPLPRPDTGAAMMTRAMGAVRRILAARQIRDFALRSPPGALHAHTDLLRALRLRLVRRVSGGADYVHAGVPVNGHGR